MHATEIAKAFVNKVAIRAIEDGDGISPLKLQKLLFLAQEEHLYRTGRVLFQEKIEAWQHGPVVRNIWNEYNGSSIKKSYEEVELAKEEEETIDKIWSKYGQFDGWYLRNLTHTYKIWQDNYDHNDEYASNEITKDAILDYRLSIEKDKVAAIETIEKLMSGFEIEQ